MWKMLCCGALCASLWWAPTTARADVIRLEPKNPCAGKQEGDSCANTGQCKQGECCRRKNVSATIRHYESKKPLAQQRPEIMNPPTVCAPCLKCEGGEPGYTETQAEEQAPPRPHAEPPAADAAPDLAPVLAPAARDAAPDQAAAPAVEQLEVARKTSGGMCASAPWESQAGAGSLLVGALLALGLMRARRPR